MKNTVAPKATTLAEVVAQEFPWILTLLENGSDEYQIAFLIHSTIAKHPHYENTIPVIVSDLKNCIQAMYLFNTAA